MILNFKSANLYFSGVCNLQCTYCFQPKIPEKMSLDNKKIIEWISSGQMEEDILQTQGSEIEGLSLWGGEPTLNLPYLIPRLPFIYEKFPQLYYIIFSTNLSANISLENIKLLLKNIAELNNKLKREVKVKIQVSIDGPPELNDTNRKGSSADRILENTKNLLLYAETFSFKDFCIIHFKGTHGSRSLDFLSSYENLLRHYSYFDVWRHECELLGIKHIPEKAELITFAVPGTFTKEDGLKYAEILKILNSTDFQNIEWKYSKKPYFKSTYQVCLADIFKYTRQSLEARNLSSLKTYSSCGAGFNNISLTSTGRKGWCHNTYFFDENLISYIKNQEFQVEEELGYDFKKYKSYIPGVSSIEDDSELLRSLNIVQVYRNDLTMKQQFFDFIIRELSFSDQISDIYKEKKQRDFAINFFLFSFPKCISSNLFTTGSVWTMSPSPIKLLLNGALEEIVKSVKIKKI